MRLTTVADGLETFEDLRFAPVEGVCEATYRGRFTTDRPDLLEALGRPAFFATGKRTRSELVERRSASQPSG